MVDVVGIKLNFDPYTSLVWCSEAMGSCSQYSLTAVMATQLSGNLEYPAMGSCSQYSLTAVMATQLSGNLEYLAMGSCSQYSLTAVMATRLSGNLEYPDFLIQY